MSKRTYTYDHVTPDIVRRVENVLGEASKHRYSVSRVYEAYNKALQKHDQPQVCSSCLRNRVRELRAWFKGYTPATIDPASTPPATVHDAETINSGQVNDLEVQPQYDDPSAPGFVAPGEGVIRHPMAEGLPIDFTYGDTDASKGTVLYADGSKVKAGSHTTATGKIIAVQPGGKATIKDEDLT